MDEISQGPRKELLHVYNIPMLAIGSGGQTLEWIGRLAQRQVGTGGADLHPI
jgi:hypothetical protein